MYGSSFPVALVVAGLALSFASPARAQWLEPGCETALEIEGATTGDTFAYWALALGDVDGDQVGDFVTTAPLSDLGASAGGFVRAVSGADGGELWTRYGNLPSGVLGYALEVADWDADGVLDVLASAPFASGGQVFVYAGTDGATLATLGPGAPGDGFGASIALGDFDGDGTPDVAIGSIGYDPPGLTNAGRVSVFSGAGGALLATIDGPLVVGGDAEFGTGLAFLGDVSQPPDGRAELVVGHRLAVFFDGRAITYSFDGATTAPLYTVDEVGMGYGLMGDRIDGGLDLDGDGLGDFVVGDRPASEAKVFSGADGTPLYTLDGEGGGNGFGPGQMIPDVDGDGRAELLLGASSDDTGEVNAGRVFLYSGASGALLRTMTYSVPLHRIGLSVRCIGDHDGDGALDFLLAGTGGGTSGPPAGRVLLVRGPSEFPRFCESTPNSTGHPATIAATGSASVGADDLVLLASPLPEGEPGLFFFGPAAIQLPFGNGFRCVGAGGAGGNVFRLPTGTIAGGQLAHALDIGAPPAAGQLLPGTTWHFQCWYRDPAGGGAGFDLSDGLTVAFTP